jgi:putative toxin-antitoxin system antitoxin component (TIGR02293 family)
MVAATKNRQSPNNDKRSHQLQELRAKTWAFMAAISVGLSDDQLIAATRDYRRLVDRARTAFFDLHTMLDGTSRGARSRRQARRKSNVEVMSLVRSMMILWWACGRQARMPQAISMGEARRRLQTIVRRSIAGEICLIRGQPTGMVALISVEDLLLVLRESTRPRLTLDGLKKGKTFQSILRKAISVFGDESSVEWWLNEPAMGLDYQIPAKLLATKAGARLVDSFLTRLEYGVYT